MRAVIRIGVLVGVGACGPVYVPGGQLMIEEASSSTAPPTTGGAESSSSGSVVTTGGTSGGSSSETGDDTTGCFADCKTDLPPEGAVCDIWQQPVQDCPEGQKCTIDDGFSNPTHCVDVVDEPKGAGEPCTVTGGKWSGYDDCDAGLMCWDVDTEGNGTCTAFCLGSPDAVMCVDPATSCSICQFCIGLCIPSCDPLTADCEAGDVCINNPSGDGFLCALDASGEEGQAHDSCEYANSCDPGLICLDATAADECDPNAAGCCEPFCALSQGDAQCPGVGQVCNPYYEEGTAPPDQVDIGYCALPQ